MGRNTAMTFCVIKTEIPTASKVSLELKDSYYSDSHRFLTKQPHRHPLQVWIDHMAKTPAWVNFLMASRNKLVSVFGLNNLGSLGAVNHDKPIGDYRVGDRIGIFTLLFLSDTEIILIDSDKHLDVKVSVYKDNKESDSVSMSTVVHVHNFFGKLYMFFVEPLHKMIVPASIKRAESTNT